METTIANARLIGLEVFKTFKTLDTDNEYTYSYEESEDAFGNSFEAALMNELTGRDTVNVYDASTLDVDRKTFNEVIGIDGFRFGGVLSNNQASRLDTAKTLRNIVDTSSSLIDSVESIFNKTIGEFKTKRKKHMEILFDEDNDVNTESTNSLIEEYKNLPAGNHINIGGGDQVIFTRNNEEFERVTNQLDIYANQGTINLHEQPIITSGDVDNQPSDSIKLLHIYNSLLKDYDISDFEKKVLLDRVRTIATTLQNFMYLLRSRTQGKFLIIKSLSDRILVVEDTVKELNRILRTNKLNDFSAGYVIRGADVTNWQGARLTDSIETFRKYVVNGEVQFVKDKEDSISEVSKALIYNLRKGLPSSQKGMVKNIPYDLVRKRVGNALNHNLQNGTIDILNNIAINYSKSTAIFIESVTTSINKYDLNKRSAILIAIARILAVVVSREIVIVNK